MRYSNYGIIRSNFICVHIFYSFPIRNVQQRRVLIVTGLVGRQWTFTLHYIDESILWRRGFDEP